MKKIKLTQKETLSMYRNACYSGMGIRSTDEKPNDFECVQWLMRVRLHAEKLQANHELGGFGMLPPWKSWIKQPLEIYPGAGQRGEGQ